jgi:hypothetical protein
MKAGKARSLLFFLLLFAVAAMALDAAYAQDRGSGGQQMMMERAHDPGIGEILEED